MVSFTVVILNAALAVLSDKVCVCVCVCGGGGGGGVSPLFDIHCSFTVLIIITLQLLQYRQHSLNM